MRGLHELFKSSQQEAGPEDGLLCVGPKAVCLSPCSVQLSSNKSRRMTFLQILRKEGFMVFLPNSEFLLLRIMKTPLLRRFVIGM